MRRYVWQVMKEIFGARKPPTNPIIVVLGATGTGKSQLAVNLAKRFNGEIINGDAVQMYHGLPIVTNKVTAEEQEGIPHHLLGFIKLEEEPWRVDNFKKAANQIILEIRARGRLPILVGGTHYYTQSLLVEDSIIEGEADGAGEILSNQEISERFPILDGPTEEMIARLKEVDPLMAERWHPRDRRKIRRSLEIYLMTRRKASDVYAEQEERKLGGLADEGEEGRSDVEVNTPLLFWIHAEAENLKKRLDSRVLKMVETGLLEEVKSMATFLEQPESLGTPVDRTRGIWVSIGFKEFEPYLEALKAGVTSPEDLNRLFDLSVEQTQAATRQYAKRQIRWIRLKLIPALQDANMMSQLYLLDGTDLSTWTDTVSNPGIEITSRFLEGTGLPIPHDVSPVARNILMPEEGLAEKPDVWFHETCELCGVTVVTDHQWKQHLDSRRHRGLLKKRRRNEGKVGHARLSAGSEETVNKP